MFHFFTIFNIICHFLNVGPFPIVSFYLIQFLLLFQMGLIQQYFHIIHSFFSWRNTLHLFPPFSPRSPLKPLDLLLTFRESMEQILEVFSSFFASLRACIAYPMKKKDFFASCHQSAFISYLSMQKSRALEGWKERWGGWKPKQG